MKKTIKKINKWHETKLGLSVFLMVELALAYGFMSWAIYNGNIICWIITIFFFVGFVKNTLKLFGRLIHVGYHKAS